jgi:hypothetical protein
MDDSAGAHRVLDEAIAADNVWCEKSAGATPKTRGDHYRGAADMLFSLTMFVPASDKLLGAFQSLLDQAPSSDEKTRAIRARGHLLRAEISVRNCDWFDAAEGYERFVEASPNVSADYWLKIAALYALAASEGRSEPDGYRRFCQSLIDRFADSDDFNAVEHTIKCCNIIELGASVTQADV